MKRIIAIVIVTVLTLALVACGGENNQNNQSNQSTQTSDVISQSENTSDAVSSADSSEESQKPEDSSTDVSDASSAQSVGDTSSKDNETIPAFLSNFISVGDVTVQARATDATAIRLTKINQEPAYGDVALYTSDYGVFLGTGFDDFVIVEFDYDDDLFGYVKDEIDEPSASNSSIDIPDDGFIVAAHKVQTDMIKKLRAIGKDVTVFPHGIQAHKVGFSIKKLSGSINFDGKISKAEWGNYFIYDINVDNEDWAFAQFDKNDYYASGKLYMTYDSDYVYLGLVVDSPFHYCPITTTDPNSMWKYECIQVKVTDQSPLSEYFAEHYDHVIDPLANNEGHVRAYGFAVNDDGETCYYENAITKTFTGKASVTRDDSAQTTTYEVAIPFAEFGITPVKGDKLGVTFSINSTNETDIAKGVWKNITLRNGGGVIGRNDWSKIPEITLA